MLVNVHKYCSWLSCIRAFFAFFPPEEELGLPATSFLAYNMENVKLVSLALLKLDCCFDCIPSIPHPSVYFLYLFFMITVFLSLFHDSPYCVSAGVSTLPFGCIEEDFKIVGDSFYFCCSCLYSETDGGVRQTFQSPPNPHFLLA